MMTILALVVCHNCKPSPVPVALPRIKGAALAHVHVRGKGYGSLADRSIYRHLKTMDIDAVQFNPFVYQPSTTEPELIDTDHTLTAEDMRDEIRYAKANGFKVMVAPHLWPGGGYPPPVWRSQMDFADRAKLRAWFANYSKFILRQAEVARDAGADIFAVGVELETLARHEAEWRELIGRVRATGLKAKLTYECEAWNAENIKFWDDLDLIGLNFYYAYPAAFNPKSQTDKAKLVAFYRENLLRHEKHARQIGKPLLFSELGFPGHARAISKTADWTNNQNGRADAIQQLAFASMREAFTSISYFQGIFFWKYVTTLDSYEKHNYDVDFILQGKPAELEIRHWSF
jgi:hypothetical protein